MNEVKKSKKKVKKYLFIVLFLVVAVPILIIILLIPIRVSEGHFVSIGFWYKNVGSYCLKDNRPGMFRCPNGDYYIGQSVYNRHGFLLQSTSNWGPRLYETSLGLLRRVVFHKEVGCNGIELVEICPSSGAY